MTIQNSAPQAQGSDPKPFNGVLLVGTIADKGENTFSLETRNFGFKKGAREQTEFVEKHPFVGSCGSFDIGARVEVLGFIARTSERGQDVYRAHAVKVTDGSSKPHGNAVKLVGRVMGKLRMFDSNPDKDPFGWLYVDTAAPGSEVPRPVRVTLFDSMLQNWHVKAYPNRLVTIVGYLNDRIRNWDSDGNPNVITEVRADERKSRLHGPDEVDVFAGMENVMAMAFGETEAPTATAPAPAADTKPAKSKRGKSAPAPAPSDDDLPI